MLSITTRANVPDEAIVCHDVRNPVDRNEILARKGSRLDAASVTSLLETGVDELHLAVPDAGDVAEDDAAAGLASAIVGPGVIARGAHFGQTSLVAEMRGMLRVDRARLDRANTFEGVLVVTAEADRPVDAEASLGVVKCAPLFLPAAIISAIQAEGPILALEPFEPKRLAFVAPANRLRGGAFERARAALSDALAWYGSSLQSVVAAEATLDGMTAAYASVRDGGAEMILAAGASGTDSLDIVFEGLRRAGGQVLQLGIPAEPGTACWIGKLGPLPVVGLASCELFGQPGALDLLLPRLLTGERLDQDLLRRLALGGLLLGPSRIAPYHAARPG